MPKKENYIAARISDDLMRRVDAHAGLKKKSRSAILNEALEAHCPELEDPLVAAVRHAAQANGVEATVERIATTLQELNVDD